jgi:hypothetical protein
MVNMNLMTVESGLAMISKFKKHYPNDYVNIKLSHGGKHFLKLENNVPGNVDIYTMLDLENDLKKYTHPDDQYKSITINGILLLNEWTFEDICNLNIHSPVNIIEIWNGLS